MLVLRTLIGNSEKSTVVRIAKNMSRTYVHTCKCRTKCPLMMMLSIIPSITLLLYAFLACIVCAGMRIQLSLSRRAMVRRIFVFFAYCFHCCCCQRRQIHWSDGALVCPIINQRTFHTSWQNYHWGATCSFSVLGILHFRGWRETRPRERRMRWTPWSAILLDARCRNRSMLTVLYYSIFWKSLILSVISRKRSKSAPSDLLLSWFVSIYFGVVSLSAARTSPSDLLTCAYPIMTWLYLQRSTLTSVHEVVLEIALSLMKSGATEKNRRMRYTWYSLISLTLEAAPEVNMYHACIQSVPWESRVPLTRSYILLFFRF